MLPNATTIATTTTTIAITTTTTFMETSLKNEDLSHVDAITHRNRSSKEVEKA